MNKLQHRIHDKNMVHAQQEREEIKRSRIEFDSLLKARERQIETAREAERKKILPSTAVQTDDLSKIALLQQEALEVQKRTEEAEKRAEMLKYSESEELKVQTEKIIEIHFPKNQYDLGKESETLLSPEEEKILSNEIQKEIQNDKEHEYDINELIQFANIPAPDVHSMSFRELSDSCNILRKVVARISDGQPFLNDEKTVLADTGLNAGGSLLLSDEKPKILTTFNSGSRNVDHELNWRISEPLVLDEVGRIPEDLLKFLSAGLTAALDAATFDSQDTVLTNLNIIEEEVADMLIASELLQVTVDDHLKLLGPRYGLEDNNSDNNKSNNANVGLNLHIRNKIFTQLYTAGRKMVKNYFTDKFETEVLHHEPGKVLTGSAKRQFLALKSAAKIVCDDPLRCGFDMEKVNLKLFADLIDVKTDKSNASLESKRLFSKQVLQNIPIYTDRSLDLISKRTRKHLLKRIEVLKFVVEKMGTKLFYLELEEAKNELLYWESEMHLFEELPQIQAELIALHLQEKYSRSNAKLFNEGDLTSTILLKMQFVRNAMGLKLFSLINSFSS